MSRTLEKKQASIFGVLRIPSYSKTLLLHAILWTRRVPFLLDGPLSPKRRATMKDFVLIIASFVLLAATGGSFLRSSIGGLSCSKGAEQCSVAFPGLELRLNPFRDEES